MKALIYFPRNRLQPKGGPAGYLYNLYSEISKERNDFFLLPDEFDITENKKLRNMMPDRIKDLRRLHFMLTIPKRHKQPVADLNEYDIVHFHSTEEMFYARDLLRDYHGITVLTSHTPCAMYKELISTVNPKDAALFEKPLRRLEIIDRYAFKRADYVIFPCREAEEPYYHTWERYKKIARHRKYRYLPTGIHPCTARVSREEYRRKLNIPQNAFVISYVGRHTEIKGYADLKEIGKLVLQDPNVYILVGGREAPIKGLDHERWIEVGWTDDPHSLIGASDVFVLPNRETYFDLVLLEVISLGTPVVLTETGGNKYFHKYGCDGLIYYNTVQEAVDCLKAFKKDDPNRDGRLSKELIEVFNKDFTVKTFAEKYISLIESLVEAEKQ